MERPKGAKEQWVEEKLGNPENWITKKCCYCGENVKMNIVFDDCHEPVYCSSCRKKLFGAK
jgi:hypothetical protein